MKSVMSIKLHLYPNKSFSPKNGCRYCLTPVALYIALATAPNIGGNGGSPIPVGLTSLSTKWTSISLGASRTVSQTGLFTRVLMNLRYRRKPSISFS